MIKELENIIKENGYSIVNKIDRDVFGRYHGIVSNNSNDKFFIKAITGKETYEYKSLQSEIEITQYLYFVTKDGEVKVNNHRLHIPRIEKALQKDNILCLITDYICEDNLLDKSSNVQAETLLQTLELMKELNKKVQLSQIKPHLKAYTRIFLLIDIPCKLVKASYLNPKLMGKFVLLAVKALSIITQLSSKALVHADINASNILFNDSIIYLTDWEQAGIGIPEYNTIAPLSVHWTDEIIRNALLNTIKNKNQIIPLLAYRTLVLFNQNINGGDPRRIRDYELLDYVISH